MRIHRAGTPEMMNCCHGGCSNCDYSRVFDSMSAGERYDMQKVDVMSA